MHDPDVFELQNQCYEAKTQMNEIRVKYVTEIQELERNRDSMEEEYEKRIGEMREAYETQIEALENMYGQKEEEVVEGNDVSELMRIVEGLEKRNLELEREKVELVSSAKKYEEVKDVKREMEELSRRLNAATI